MEEINKENFGNFLILTNTENQIENTSNKIVIDKFPVEVKYIIEKVNISLLRQNYSLQSEVLIKEYKLKVQSQIQGDQIRVSGKKIDDLQDIMNRLKSEKLDVALQFINFKK